MEMWLTVIVTVLTNLFALPSVVLCWRRGRMHEAVVGLALCVVSILYHSSEALEVRVWGMNPGQWHRLDNVFIITVMISLALSLTSADPDAYGEATPFEIGAAGADAMDVHTAKARQRRDRFLQRQRRGTELWRWVLLAVTVVCQEKGPWVEFYTFLPIVLGWAVGLVRLLVCTPREFRPLYSVRTLVAGVVLLLCGLLCFVRGLDDGSDYLRMWHGMWHLFGSLGVMVLFYAKRTLPHRPVLLEASGHHDRTD